MFRLIASDQTPAPIPRSLWVAVLMSPLLGWLSALVLLFLAVRRLMTQGIRFSCAHLWQGHARWLAVTALLWWLVLLSRDLTATPPVPWWQDLRFLLVIVPPLWLMPQLQRWQVSYPQLAQWATWSVWITVAVVALEYVVVVHWAGMVHHRPRALSGNALLVSVMLLPMMLLCWLGASTPSRWAWMRPLATHVLGIVCLASLLGARAATVIAIGLLPMALLWQRREWGVPVGRILLGATFALVSAGLLLTPVMSGWYEQRWAALIQVMAGQNPAALGDYGIATRALHWPAAWQAIADRPWLGYGFLNETATLRQHLPAGTPVLPTAHQQFLSFMLWSGVPGLITGCAIMALPMVLAVIRRRGSTGLYAAFALSLPMMLNGLFDTVLDDLRIVSHYLMLVVLVDAAVEGKGSPPGRVPT